MAFSPLNSSPQLHSEIPLAGNPAAKLACRGTAKLLPHIRLLAMCCAVLAATLVVEAPRTGAEVRAYTIDPRASKLRLQLFRTGVFSLLAHDHVLLAESIAGRVLLDTQDLSRSSMQLSVPVTSLRVDPLEERLTLGLDGELDEEDRAEIREAMLSAEQLDAPRFPRVVATLDSLTGDLPEVVLAVRLRIRGTERVIQVPVRVTASDTELRASGEISLLQSQFGIEPYSALLGTLAVDDRVLVDFELIARRPGS